MKVDDIDCTVNMCYKKGTLSFLPVVVVFDSLFSRNVRKKFSLMSDGARSDGIRYYHGYIAVLISWRDCTLMTLY